MYQPKVLEQIEIERLSKREADEPAFVAKEKEQMIKLIKEGKGDEIEYDEWGEVYYLIDPDTEDEQLSSCC